MNNLKPFDSFNESVASGKKDIKSLFEDSFVEHNQKAFQKIKQKVKPFFDKFEDIKGLYIYIGGDGDQFYFDGKLPKNVFFDLVKEVYFVNALGLASVKVNGKVNKYHSTDDESEDVVLIQFDDLLESTRWEDLDQHSIITFTDPNEKLLYIERDSLDIKFVKSKPDLEFFQL